MISFRHTAAAIKTVFACAFTQDADRQLNASLTNLNKVLDEHSRPDPVALLIDRLVDR